MLNASELRDLAEPVIAAAIRPAGVRALNVREIVDSQRERAFRISVATDLSPREGAAARSAARIEVYQALEKVGETRSVYLEFVGPTLEPDNGADDFDRLE